MLLYNGKVYTLGKPPDKKLFPLGIYKYNTRAGLIAFYSYSFASLRSEVHFLNKVALSVKFK